MKMPNLKKYDNFDDFVIRNDVEIMSFKDGIIARWKSSKTYKSGMQRVTETSTNQIIGKDYVDLSKKLKKELRKLYHLPWTFLIGIIMCVGLISTGISTDFLFMVIFGIVMGLSSSYFSVVQIIELINAKKILKSHSVLTRDFVKTNFYGIGSLFRDVFEKIEEEESKIYKGEL